MKIIRNNIIPFKGYKAMNLFGILFVREDAKLTDVDLNHEAIHSAQFKELLWIFYYPIYLIEWLIRVLFSKDRLTHKAYRNISFEQEAYKNEDNLDYLKTRKLFAMWR